MPLNLTNYAYAMKRLFPAWRRAVLTFEDHPFLSEVSKDTTVNGDEIAIPVRYAASQGISPDIAKAKANRTSHKGKRFLVTLADLFETISVSHKAILASRNQEGAFLKARESELEMAMRNFGDRMADALYGKGSGSLGQRGSIASTTVTLKDKHDIYKFEEGMVLVANDTDNATSVRSGSMTVTAVDYDAGTFTVDADDITGFANDDFIFLEGAPDAYPKGLKAWFPIAAPTSGDSFFGVDRSANPSRLAGNRLDATTDNLDTITAFQRIIYKCEQRGGRPTRLYCSWSKFADIQGSLDNKAQFVDVQGGVAGIGWQGLKLFGRKGPVVVLPDKSCDDTLAYCIDPSSVKLISYGPAPSVIDEDGLQWRFDESTAELVLDLAAYYQLVSDAPGHNGVVKLAASSALV